MKDLIESIRQMYQPRTEATMMKNSGEVVHNCAKHVEHAQYGKGKTIAEEHADPDRYGNIAWYDVMFEHGIERGMPVSELSILQSESHGHATKKAKKMSEAEDLSMDRKKSKANMEDDDEDENEKEDDDEDKPKKMKKMSEAVKHGMKEEVEGLDEKEGYGSNDPLAARADYAKRHGTGQVYKKTYPGDKVGMSKSYAYDIKRTGPKKKLPEEVDFPIQEDHDQSLPEPVDETIITAVKEYDITEAKKSSGYDAHFRAMMTKHGVKHPGELDTPEKKKAFFNKVDASYKAKNEDVFLEAMMASDLQKIKDAHKKAGNKISDETSGSKAGQAHHSFVVTQPSGKRTRHIYHGSTKKVETMSPAPRSKESAEQDLDDK
jgi:hypothetical protein